MDGKERKHLRPLNHSYKRDWYWDYDKRLRDAEVTQFGHEDPDFHADGVHRQQFDPFSRR